MPLTILLLAGSAGCASVTPESGSQSPRYAAPGRNVGEWDLARPDMAPTVADSDAAAPDVRRRQPLRVDDREFLDEDVWLTRPVRERAPASPPDEEDSPTEYDPLAPHLFGEWDIDQDWAWGDTTNVSGADGTIRLRIRGNRVLTNSTLRAAASEALRDLAELPAPRLTGLDAAERAEAIEAYRRRIRSITDDAAYLMQRHYEGLGYYWARTAVEWDFDDPDPRQVGVTFRVLREEPRVLLAGVEFHGVDVFEPARLREFFGAPDAILFGQTYYVERIVEQAREDLLAMYREAGYVRVEVDVRKPQTEGQWGWSPGRSTSVPPDLAHVVVHVNEGRLYRLAQIELELADPTAAPPANVAQLRAALNRFLGQPYRRGDHGLIVAEVREFFLDRGHVRVAADIPDDADGVYIDDGRAQVTITVSYDPGRVYRIGAIHVQTESLSDAFIRSIVPLQPGEVYRISDVRAAYRQIVRTNVVRTTTIDVDWPSLQVDADSNEIDLRIVIDEVPSVELRPYVGWGSYEQLRGSLYLAENNLFGIARVLSLEVGASLKSEWANLTYADAWTLGGDWPFSIGGFYLRRDDPSFSRQEIGARVSVRHAVTSRLDTSLFYEYIDTRAFGLDDPLIDSRDFHVQLGKLTLRTQFATISDRVSPMEGMVHTFTAGLSLEPLGSTVEFVHLRLHSTLYVPLSREARVVLAFRYLGEVNLPLGDYTPDDIPVQQRIFNGGATSVRSFTHQGMRPFNDPDNSLGGQGRNVATVELRLPMILEAGLDGALFADAGNIAPSLDSFFNHWRFALGFGFRYLTPVGPARLDVAWSPVPGQGEERWLVHFWIGYPF